MEQMDQNGSTRGNTESHALNSDNKTDCKNGANGANGARGHQHFYWCFTYNNYDENGISRLIQILDHECNWYVFQEEKGDSGTPHLQGTLYLKKKQRMSALKKWNKSIHWESTNCVSGSIAYCSSEPKRCGQIWSNGITLPEPLEIDEPYGWQLTVLDIIKEKPDKRTIHWFYEPNGNVGKTTLVKYLCVKHGATLIGGKANDAFFAMKKAIDNNTYKRLVVCNLPRSSLDFVNYGALECIKDGLVFSGKYESGQLIFNCPHLIVFANALPTGEMSADRWKIYNIDTLIKNC